MKLFSALVVILFICAGCSFRMPWDKEPDVTPPKPVIEKPTCPQEPPIKASELPVDKTVINKGIQVNPCQRVPSPKPEVMPKEAPYYPMMNIFKKKNV